MVTSTPVGDVFLRVFKKEFGAEGIVLRPGLPECVICPETSMNEYEVDGCSTLNLSWHPSKVCNFMHGAAWSAALIRITGLVANNLLHHPEYIAAVGEVLAGLTSESREEHALLIQAVRLCPGEVKAALLADKEGAAPHATALMMLLVSNSSALHAAHSSLISAEQDLGILDSILRGSKESEAVVPMVCKEVGDLCISNIAATMRRRLQERGLDIQKISASQLRWKAAISLVSMSAGEQGRRVPDPALMALLPPCSPYTHGCPCLASPFRWFSLLLTRGAPLFAVPGASAAACDRAWKDAPVGLKERAKLVAAVAAVDVSTLGEAAAREAKEKVVRKQPSGKGLTKEALSGLFREAGRTQQAETRKRITLDAAEAKEAAQRVCVERCKALVETKRVA